VDQHPGNPHPGDMASFRIIGKNGEIAYTAHKSQLNPEPNQTRKSAAQHRRL